MLLQANPDVKNAIAVGGQRASNLLAEHRPKSPASVAPSEHKSVAFSAAPSPQRGNDGASMATDASKKPVSALGKSLVNSSYPQTHSQPAALQS